jgi:archaemetzincin
MVAMGMKPSINIVYSIDDIGVINSIIEAIKEVYGFDVSIEYNNLNIDFAYNSLRKQYDALKILFNYRYPSNKNVLTLLVVSGDIYVSPLNFCFGLAIDKIAIISTFRLQTTNRELFLLRCKKEAIHEIGHMLGLSHCKNSYCVMFFSNSILDTDRKDYKICNACRSRLKI